MNGGYPAGEILVAVASHGEACVYNHVPEVLLARESLDAFHEVLIAVSVCGDQLPDEGNGAEGPLLVNGVQERVPVDL